MALGALQQLGASALARINHAVSGLPTPALRMLVSSEWTTSFRARSCDLVNVGSMRWL
jgi:hypothetical protein